MSRKRKSDKESTETATATETSAAAESATAVAEPPAVEAQPEGRSFAEKVGKKKQVSDPDPFPFATDDVANVRLFQSKQDRQMAISSAKVGQRTRPSQAVIDTMKRSGLAVGRGPQGMGAPVQARIRQETQIEAEAFYQELRKMIRQEKGIEAGPEQGVPF